MRKNSKTCSILQCSKLVSLPIFVLSGSVLFLFSARSHFFRALVMVHIHVSYVKNYCTLVVLFWFINFNPLSLGLTFALFIWNIIPYTLLRSGNIFPKMIFSVDEVCTWDVGIYDIIISNLSLACLWTDYKGLC